MEDLFGCNYTKHTIANSLEELEELVDAKLARKESIYSGEAISYFIDTDEKIEDALKYAEEHNDKVLNRVVTELKEHRGEKVMSCGKVGVFEAIEDSHDDFYYIVRFPNGKKVGESCVGKLEFVKE